MGYPDWINNNDFLKSIYDKYLDPDIKEKYITRAGLTFLTLAVCWTALYHPKLTKTYEDIVHEAHTYLEAERFELAETTCQKAIDMDSTKSDAYIELTNVYIEQYRMEEALDILEEAEDLVDGTYSSDISEEKELVQEKRERTDLLKEGYDLFESSASIDAFYDYLDRLSNNSTLIDEIREESIIYIPGNESSGTGLGIYTDYSLLLESGQYSEFHADSNASLFLYYGNYIDGKRNGTFNVVSSRYEKVRMRFYEVTMSDDNTANRAICTEWRLNDTDNQWIQGYTYDFNFEDHKLSGEIYADVYTNNQVSHRVSGTAANGFYNRIPGDVENRYIILNSTDYHIYYTISNNIPYWYEFLP